MTGIILSCAFFILAAAPVNAAYLNQDSMLSSVLSAEGWSYSQKGVQYYRSGSPVVGLQTIDGKSYYFNADGYLQTGWQTLDGKRYYFDQSGVMQTGWVQSDGARYYLDKNGVPVTGQQTIDSVSCYFASSGVLVREGTGGAIPEDIQEKIKTAPLSAKKTVNEELNKEIENRMSLLDLKDADTFTKVKTVYDFMTVSYSQGEGALFVGMDTFLQIMEGPESDALQMLRTGEGESDGYAAAFAAVLRTIGLDARVVQGTLSTGSARENRSWVVVKIQGTEYVFDPLEEQVQSGEGRNLYSRFGKTYEQLGNLYQPVSYFDFQ